MTTADVSSSAPGAASHAAPPSAPVPGSLKLFLAFLILACTALSVLVVLLARENRQLKAREAALILNPPGRPPAVKVGDALAPVTLLDKSGTQAQYAFADPGHRTLIFAISGGCPHCATIIPVWNQILRQVASPQVRVVCIQLEAQSPDKIEELGADFPIHGVIDARSTWLFAIPAVPATILAGPDGVVEHTWFGELSDAQQEELGNALIEASATGG